MFDKELPDVNNPLIFIGLMILISSLLSSAFILVGFKFFLRRIDLKTNELEQEEAIESDRQKNEDHSQNYNEILLKGLSEIQNRKFSVSFRNNTITKRFR